MIKGKEKTARYRLQYFLVFLMFYLHLSNRTERLIDKLIQLIDEEGRPDIFEVEFFLIQSQGMERFLSQKLASAFSAWCNFDYLLPTKFFDQIAAKLGIEHGLSYQRELMVWQIDSLLRNLQGDILQPLYNYVQGADKDLKRFQLAYQLANLFDQYQLMRPRMLDSWGRGETVTTNSAELWQMEIWNQLTAGLSGQPHRGEFYRQFCRLLAKDAPDLSLLPSRVSVFGLSSIPPLLLQCLKALALHCEVHFFLLSPCREYWGDLETPSRLARQRLHNESVTGSDSFSLPNHPLLASLGILGKEFQDLLLSELETCRESENYEEPLDAGAPTLLHSLQAGLLHNSLVDGSNGAGKDDSIRIVSCHTRLRELEVLKDHILSLLHHNSDMSLRDIVVMAPDIQEYSGFIGAVFADIPHSIADRTHRQSNNLLAIFLQFLDLAGGRCGWSLVLDLLEKEEVYPGFGLQSSDLETLRHLVTDSGIRWGLSAEHRSFMGLPAQEETSWRSGLDRLLMGYACSSTEFVEGILPYPDIEGSMATCLGGLCEFVALLEGAQQDFSKDFSLKEWTVLFLDYAERLFAEEEVEGVAEFREMMFGLHESVGEIHGHLLGISVIREWLEQRLGQVRSSSGFLSGQLTFCSMLPMRSIPFEGVCLLGLTEGSFPAPDNPLVFDLAGESFQPGDRSKRNDDRYQFLEAILSARKHFYISYIGQSQRTNEKISPSTVICELIELLELNYGVKSLVEEQPLQGFSSAYFKAGSQLKSYDQDNCSLAQALIQPKTASPLWWSGDIDGFAGKCINLSDLLRFFLNPQKWFVRNRLSIHLEHGDEVIPDHEPFSLSSLDSYLTHEKILNACREGKKSSEVLRKLQLSGRFMLGSHGQLQLEKQWHKLADFVELIEEKKLGQPLPDVDIKIQLGEYQLVGELAGLYEGGMLLARYADLKGKDLLKAWLCRLILTFSSSEEIPLYLLARDVEFCFGEPENAEQSLIQLLEIYLQGWEQPSPFWIEPAFAYVRQLDRAGARKSPLEVAKEKLQYVLDNGYEPEWSLLLRNRQETALGQEFVTLCESVLYPIWRFANGN